MSGAMPDDVMHLKERCADGGAIHENIERTVHQGGGGGDSLVCNVPKEARSAIGIAEGGEVRITVFRNGYFVQPVAEDD